MAEVWNRFKTSAKSSQKKIVIKLRFIRDNIQKNEIKSY